jgi:ATP-dependent Lhr-like helicase
VGPVDSEPGAGPATEELAEAVAIQLLDRWGVMAWDLWSRESYRIPWRDVVRAFRRLEARGQVLGGRFVAGISGEQYATAEAAALLTEVRRDPGRGADVVVAGADPLNLTGGVLNGDRVPALRHRTVRFEAGLPTGPQPDGDRMSEPSPPARLPVPGP